MKQEIGKYYISFYGHYGEKIKVKSAVGFVQAKHKADKYMLKNPTHSIVINRVIYNSKTPNDKRSQAQ